MSYRSGEEHPFLGKEIVEQREFSEHTAQIIDEEVSRILIEADTQARELLAKYRDKLDLLARNSKQREVLDEVEIIQLIGPSVNTATRITDSPISAPIGSSGGSGETGECG